MRATSVVRRLLAVAGAAVLTAGVLVLGSPAPAFADSPPEVTLAAECGSALVTFGEDASDEPPIELWTITVLRDGVVVQPGSRMEEGSTRRYGASDGNVFTFRFNGYPDQTLTYHAPDDCLDSPRLTVTTTVDCSGVEFHLANTGTKPITGLWLTFPVELVEVEPVAPGVAVLRQEFDDGIPYALGSGPTDDSAVLWFEGRYSQPDGCGPDSVTATFTDGCDVVRIALTNPADSSVRLDLLVDGDTVESPNLAAGASEVFTVPAAAGASVVVRDSGLDVELLRHTVAAVDCASPTPTGDAEGDDGDTDGTAGGAGGLPVTGAQTIALGVGGMLVLAAGLVLFLVARRRRLRFTTPD